MFQTFFTISQPNPALPKLNLILRMFKFANFLFHQSFDDRCRRELNIYL